MTPPLSWPDLEARTDFQIDTVNGPTNAQARLRLFGQSETDVRVTLYRDHHAWCPYCQKIWLWLEEKQIPYRIEKVTMFCYGEKESWYKRKVPSGMLPAVELDGRLITESDDILVALERAFGPLGWTMTDPRVLPLRQLERLLFRAWCSWLCYPTRSAQEDQRNRDQFTQVVTLVEDAFASTPGPYFLEDFGIVDVVFTPYVERMNASLYYYKGYSLREANPGFSAWFDAMETRPTYRGTQSDFHTHAHDLPPQMGGCYENGEPQMQVNKQRVDQGPWLGLPDVTYPEPETARTEALQRVLKHRDNIIQVNPADDRLFDEALRCALTHLITGETCPPPPGSDSALRYLRDRISVPRDMSIYAAKRLRMALEETAALVGDRPGPPILKRHRRDQDPANFAPAPEQSMAADLTPASHATPPSGGRSAQAGTRQNWIGDFGVGAGLSAIAVLTLLGISLWTTQTTLAQIGPLEIAALLAIPLGCGAMAVVFKQPFTDALAAVLNSLPL